jgi:DNA (cytosine-5)-methyltransferase 1
MITIGTDCSGIEAPLEALRQLRIPYKQLWRCEIDKYARLSASANYPEPHKIYEDILNRNHKELPRVDIYVCGFPCQSFSMVGKRLGTSDPRSNVINEMVASIKASKPKIIILENVRGFLSIEGGKPLEKLKKILGKEYNLDVSLYNTKDYGLPQTRTRVYFVGIRRDLQKKPFVKPSEVKMKPLTDIVDSNVRGSKTHKSMSMIDKSKRYKDCFYNIINMGFLTYGRGASKDKCPAIITGNPHFIYELNRVFSLKELLQLQGFPKSFKVVVTPTQIIKQIGNSMSVCVVKKVIQETLMCI